MIDQLTREHFMKFFRNNELLNTLSTDDRIEVFATILPGNSDFTLELFEKLLADYCVEHLRIVKVENN